MNRKICFPICLLLVAGMLLGLTACRNKSDAEESFHFPYEDLPDVQESEVAYLLDPEFVVTEENISDCIYDYFSAPSILYYNTFAFSYNETPFIKNEKAVDFAEVFQDVSWEQISGEEFLAYDTNFNFYNAVGALDVFEYEGSTYISFSRENDFVNDEVLFRATCLDLLPDLFQTAISLRDVSGRTDPDLEYYLEKFSAHNMYDDLSDIKESDAAYLLDPNFIITEENFLNCIYDYFTAPATLRFGDLRQPELEIKDPERTKAFAEVFRDFSPTVIPPVSSSDLSETTRPDDDDYRGSYCFTNAIGNLRLDSWKDVTYVDICRDNVFVHDTYGTVTFCLQGNLFSELVPIGTALESNAKEPTYRVWQREEESSNHWGYHPVAHDRPKVWLSDAFYLLDPEFAVTEENFVDCIDDYFAAPSILLYDASPLYDYRYKFIRSKKAAKFASVFHDLTLTQISEEEFPNDYQTDTFTFHNAIGELALYEREETTYIFFSRKDDPVTDQVIFQVEGADPIKELDRIAVSLDDIAKKPHYENEGE